MVKSSLLTRQHVCDVAQDFDEPAIHDSTVFDCEVWLLDSSPWPGTVPNPSWQGITLQCITEWGHPATSSGVILWTEFGGSIYQKEIYLDTGKSCLGTRYKLDLFEHRRYQSEPTASVSAKPNNSSSIGMSYFQTLPQRSSVMLVKLESALKWEGWNFQAHSPWLSWREEGWKVESISLVNDLIKPVCVKPRKDMV